MGKCVRALLLFTLAWLIYGQNSYSAPNQKGLDKAAQCVKETREQEELAAAIHAVKSAEASAKGKQDPGIADALDQLAEVHRKQGRPDQAEAPLIRAKDIRLSVFGPGSTEAAAALRRLGLLYLKRQRYADAEPLLKQALLWRQIARDEPDHPDVVQSLADLGILYLFFDAHHAQAEPYLKQAIELEDAQAQQDKPSPKLATWLNYLGSLYVKEERYAEALLVCERALAIDEEVLGKAHPEVATDVSNLAVLYQATGRLTEAEQAYQRARAIQQKTLGPNDLELVETTGQLAGLLHQQGRSQEAETLYRQALASAKAVLGPRDPEVIELTQAYAALLKETGRADEARLLESQLNPSISGWNTPR